MDIFDIDELVPKLSPVSSGSVPHQAGPSSGRRPKASADDCLRVLNDTFGYDAFRGQQQTICETALTGQDILVIAPTGMGKSLCFQVPAIAEKTGLTLVVSPLLALMKNQVTGLRKKGVHATAFTSETTAAEKSNILADLSSGRPRYRLLYITPEKLNTVEFIRLMDQLYANGNLNRFTVDEAHCISEWGHDFRDSYRKLGYFRERYPDVPIMALTASATATVQDDIVRSLRMSDQMFKVVHPFNRDNLFYEVQYRSGVSSNDRYMDVHAYIDNLHRRRGKPSSGIVYCRTRATCNELSDFLRRKGINAKPYHKGVGAKALDVTLKAWEHGGSGEMGGHVVDVVCATIAFGMGIDKGDVRCTLARCPSCICGILKSIRYIIHYDLPKSFEGYYQETGRAGRDGVPSKCVMFYSREDAVSVRRWVGSSHTKRVSAADPDGPPPSQRSNKSLGQLLKFAENVDVCRHVLICRYFGEIVDESDDESVKQLCNRMCDVCKTPEKVKQRKAELSTQEFACSHAPVAEESDDEAIPPTRLNQTVQRNGSFNAWTAVPKPTPGSMNKKRGPLTPWFERDEGNATTSAGRATAKKPKLATSTFNLTSSRSLSKAMKKPFKTPFMLPVSKSQDENDPENPLNVWSSGTDLVEDQNGSAWEKSVHEVVDLTADDCNEEPPLGMNPPAISAEENFLDMEFSEKVALGIRKETFQALFNTLWTAIIGSGTNEAIWAKISSPPVPHEKRSRLLLGFARHTEWQMLSWSKSDVGYADRLSDSLGTIGLLSRLEAWADNSRSQLADAQELASDLRDFALSWKER